MCANLSRNKNLMAASIPKLVTLSPTIKNVVKHVYKWKIKIIKVHFVYILPLNICGPNIYELVRSPAYEQGEIAERGAGGGGTGIRTTFRV